MEFTSDSKKELKLSEMDIKLAIMDFVKKMGYEDIQMRDVDILTDSYSLGTGPYAQEVTYCKGALVTVRR